MEPESACRDHPSYHLPKGCVIGVISLIVFLHIYAYLVPLTSHLAPNLFEVRVDYKGVESLIEVAHSLLNTPENPSTSLRKFVSLGPALSNLFSRRSFVANLRP